MNYAIHDYATLSDELQRLKLNTPEQLSFFPENLSDAKSSADLIYTDSIHDFQKIFRLNSLSIPQLADTPAQFRTRKSADFFAPGLFVTGLMISNNPNLVSVALNIISTYITDIFKGTAGEKKVKFEVITDDADGNFKKVVYEGPVSGIKDLEKVIKSLR